MSLDVKGLLKSLRNTDIEVLEDAVFFAFLTFTPIICFQQLLSPFLSISEKWVLTIFYYVVSFRRVHKLLDAWFEEVKL